MVNGACHILTGLDPTNPPTDPPNFLSASPFHTKSHCIAVGDRPTAADTWSFCPADPDDLFAPKNVNLAAWRAIKTIKINARHPYILTKSTQATLCHPLIPLWDPDICRTLHEGIYGPHKLSLRAIIKELVPYAEAINHEPTRKHLQNSIAGLISRASSSDTANATNLALNDTAAADAANASVLHQWAVPRLEAAIAPPQSHTAHTQNPAPAPAPSHTPHPQSPAPAPATQRTVTFAHGTPGGAPGVPGPPNAPPPTTAGTPGASAPAPTNSPAPSPAQQPAPTLPPGYNQGFGPNMANTLYNQQQAAYHRSVFYTQALPTTPPPAQRQRPDEETGFDNLPMERKCALMTFSNATSAAQLSLPLLKLLKATKRDRNLVFQNEVLKPLQKANPRAFADFQYPPDFINQLCDGHLTNNDPTGKWWHGLVGAHLRRGRADIQALNYHLELANNPMVTYTVYPNQASRLQSKAPPMPTTVQEVMDYCDRLEAFCRRLFTPGPVITATMALEVNQLLLADSNFLVYGRDAQYLRIKLKEIIFTLYKMERDEFAFVLPENAFTTPGQPIHFFDDMRWQQKIEAAVNPNRMYLDSHFRNCPEFLPTPPPNTNDPTDGRRRPRRNDRQTNTTDNPGGNPNSNQNNTGLPPNVNPGDPNPHWNQVFKNYFQSLPEHVRRERATGWLRNADTTLADAKQILGLDNNECFKLHTKGKYCHRDCYLVHRARALPNDACERIVQLFQRGRATAAPAAAGNS